jgi:hypothetical protein
MPRCSDHPDDRSDDPSAWIQDAASRVPSIDKVRARRPCVVQASQTVVERSAWLLPYRAIRRKWRPSVRLRALAPWSCQRQHALGLFIGQCLQLRPRLLLLRGADPRGDRADARGGTPADRRDNPEFAAPTSGATSPQNPGFRHSSSMTAPCTRPTRPRAAGVEFLMGYYGILDRAPKGRDERRDAGVDPPARRVLSTGSEPSAVNREASSRPRVLQVAGSRCDAGSMVRSWEGILKARCRNADSESAARRSRRSGSVAWGRPPPMARLRIDRR